MPDTTKWPCELMIASRFFSIGLAKTSRQIRSLDEAGALKIKVIMVIDVRYRNLFMILSFTILFFNNETVYKITGICVIFNNLTTFFIAVLLFLFVAFKQHLFLLDDCVHE